MDQGKNIPVRASGEHEKRLLLVIDGDVSSSFYTSILLQRLEYNIHTVKTAEDALEIIKIVVPSLILTELTLPLMSGIAFLKHIKKTPRTGSIPVIIYTGEKKLKYGEKCLRAGCAGYLEKPADPNELYAAIQSATEPAPRRVIRFRTRLGVIVDDDKADPHGEGDYVTYLSENGLYISTQNPQPIGTLLPIVFCMSTVRIKTEAIVLYSFTKRNKPFQEHGMGLRFVQISPEDKELIRTFIMTQLTQDLALTKNFPPL